MSNAGFELYSEVIKFNERSADELARDEAHNLQIMLKERTIKGFAVIPNQDGKGYEFYIVRV